MSDRYGGGSRAEICWKLVVNIGGGDRGVSGRDCQLMQIGHYISYRINALYRGFLMGIDSKVPIPVHLAPRLVAS